MTVLLRADASAEIGTGHIMRCLALAGRMAEGGETPVFVARDIFPNLADRITAAGYKLMRLAPATSRNDDRRNLIPHAHWLAASWQDDVAATLAIATAERASWIVIDHYGIDRAWQAAARAAGICVAVLDDLADREHDADLLVDPSVAPNPHARYAALLPPGRQRLLGPRYAILRPEFSNPPDRHPHAGLNYLVAFGGVDAAGMTLLALDALGQLVRRNDNVDVVVGGQNAALAHIRAQADTAGWRVHIDTDAMGLLMAKADLAVGAGGHMLWERAAMRLPSIAVIVAENQREQVLEAGKLGLVAPLDGTTLDAATLRAQIARLAGDSAARAAMAEACARVDGRGGLRIAQRIVDSGVVCHPAKPGDRDRLLAWRNDERIRRVSRDPVLISAATHTRWFDAVLADAHRHLLVGADAAGPLGVVRFDRDAAGQTAEVSIYLAPTRLGAGKGAHLLLAGEDWLRQNLGGPVTVLAEVLAGNATSEELFLSCGYDRRSGRFEKLLETQS